MTTNGPYTGGAGDEPAFTNFSYCRVLYATTLFGPLRLNGTSSSNLTGMHTWSACSEGIGTATREVPNHWVTGLLISFVHR